MESRLQLQLGALAESLRRWKRCRAMAICWGAAAALGLVLLTMQTFAGIGINHYLWILPLAVGLVLAGSVVMQREKAAGDIQDLIREIEQEQPELRHLLAAAAEQKPAGDSGHFSFLQFRVIEEALAHPRQAEWRKEFERRLANARVAEAGALLVLMLAALAMRPAATPGTNFLGSLLGEAINVTPGDTEVERNTGLVVAARFHGTLPSDVTLVLNTATGKESRIPMARELADPVFGASLPMVSEAGTYHVEYRGKKTRDYKISVFEYPALVRADATLKYPAYTGLTNRMIKDTLRVTAVEGSHLSYTMVLNKPVTQARWVGKEQTISLALQSNATALLPDYLLTNSARFRLELTDADGRTNKFPSDFVLQAITNQRPMVKLDLPKGDQRVSKLEELQLQAEASDDFGLLKYGIGYGVAGQDPKLVDLGTNGPANVKKKFNYLLSMEALGVDEDQVVGYFAWADDYGPDGEPRRTYSDIYFATMRPFEEVFRADQSGAGDNGGGQRGGNRGQGQGQQGGGNQRVQLADLQKQIVVATWNLQREKQGAGAAQKP